MREIKNVRDDSRCPGWDSKAAPLAYKSEVLLLQPPCVNINTYYLCNQHANKCSLRLFMHKQAADVTGHISRFCLTKYELRHSSAVRRTVSLCALQLSGMFSILSCLTRFTNCIGYADLHEGIFNRERCGGNWLWLFSGCRSRESAVGIATAYGLDGRGIGDRVPVYVRFFLSPRRPDRFLGPPSLLSSRYGGSFPRDKTAGA
jgi:hypothetical protein